MIYRAESPIYASLGRQPQDYRDIIFSPEGATYSLVRSIRARLLLIILPSPIGLGYYNPPFQGSSKISLIQTAILFVYALFSFWASRQVGQTRLFRDENRNRWGCLTTNLNLCNLRFLIAGICFQNHCNYVSEN